MKDGEYELHHVAQQRGEVGSAVCAGELHNRLGLSGLQPSGLAGVQYNNDLMFIGDRFKY
jgi:hypothetical protein